MRPVVFSGTTEGRSFSEKLTASGVSHIVCVATEYGELVMEKSDFAQIRSGRMNVEEMTSMIVEEASVVFDATHPYAVQVSENIKEACKNAGREYVRILRDCDTEQSTDDVVLHSFADTASCAEALKNTKGNILLTTGSKELKIYADDPEVRDRLFVRVLPSKESISLCEEAGITGKQIIAMQGPFTRETDLALIRQFDIKLLVTKSSGSAGGVPEKIRAAAEAGIPVFMIGRPADEHGMPVEEALEKYFDIRQRLYIDLVGIGPGRTSLMTIEAEETARKADIIFGASRMLEAFSDKVVYPFYRAEDIIPVLEAKHPHRVVVLFSGDTGYYSGCNALYPKLKEWAKSKALTCDINIIPGISSFSYLASKAGVSYQNAKLISIHGTKDAGAAKAALLSAVRYHRKTFVLLSGAEDVRFTGDLLERNGLGHVSVTLGSDLSYPEEKIHTYTCSECCDITEKGLYIALIQNPAPQKRRLMPVLNDSDMIRAKVPMTKESIRHLSVIRLELTSDAVVYDIGSGTGSVACEIAGLDDSIMVYAIEMKEEACSLISENADNLGLSNIKVIPGKAPESMKGLMPATHAFIGGSAGNLREILEELVETSPGIRVVINAVSLETMAEITSVVKDFDVSELTIEQVSVNRSRELGNYHLMTAENPVMIAAFNLGGSHEE